jgi:hypothetical protein
MWSVLYLIGVLRGLLYYKFDMKVFASLTLHEYTGN